ncbi:MAG: hypothetical protein Q9160_004337 [Pyrenula sp. 1 TL-2023]
MTKKPPYTVEVQGVEKKKGETIPRRNLRAKDKLITRPAEDVATTYENLKRAAAKYGNAKCIGTRRLIKNHVENKKIKKVVDGKETEVDKKWTYAELSEYTYMSFIEFEKLALQLGAGLRKLGMKKDDKVHLYGATRYVEPALNQLLSIFFFPLTQYSANWLAMSYGASSQTMPIVTAYDTLGEEGLRHSLLQTKSRAIFLDPSLIPTFSACLKDATTIEYVIYNSDSQPAQSDIDKVKSINQNVTVVSFEEIRKSGEDNPVDVVTPTPEDLLCVMYTSGSTGAPKGVLLKHKAVVAAMAGVNAIVGPCFSPADDFLTYLPQSHIFEFMFENLILFWGGTMGFGNPRTLSDQAVRGCKGDIREFRPTIIVGVPAVWESVKKGIIGKVNGSSFMVKKLFWGSLSAKSFLLNNGLPGSALLDSLVFNKIKDATGGRMRLCLNGGGPISTDTQIFISMAICPMLGGYGLTETSAMGAVNNPLAWDPTVLGEIPGSVEIKLVDFEDANYYSTNDPPQGEIWIRGDSIAEGYFDNEKETKEAFTEDGWFKTGDIGEFDRNGHLRIIDRKKNLVKTLNGEYIALEKLESVYRSAPVVGNICVYAASDKAKPIAIIVPVEAALEKLASSVGVKSGSLEGMLQDKKLNGAVLKEILNQGRQQGLNGIELIDGIVMAEEEWTPQNGFMTAAQKIQRKKIVEKYQKEIERAYGGK